ncbi:MAG: peptidase M22 [Pseudomonadota bacterium]|nr:peptidase M22 [Pseudomonadota bacterium]
MINNFLIINCIGKDDKLGLRINKDFFIHKLKNVKNNNDKLVLEVINFLKTHKAKIDNNFSVIVNQGPGSFSGIRISLAVAKGLEISKKVQLYGYNNEDLREFNHENINKLLKSELLEKKLIKPIYLS